MEEYKGIYAYIDKKTDKIVYIGKDSNLHRKIRHQQHHIPSKYNVQRINQILQTNPNRYEYIELIKLNKNVTDKELNELEINYISLYDPKFNFTEGGDGFGSGKNNPNFGLSGMDSPFFKDYARVIKGGFKGGKQTYNLEFKSKTLTTSIDKDNLQKLADEINKGANPDELLKKPIAIINKEGTRRGEQYYAIVVDKKRKKISRDLDFLQKICDDINNGIDINKALNNYKDTPRIVKAGKIDSGRQYYALVYSGKRIKRSADKEYLQHIMDDINIGIDVDVALKRNEKSSKIKFPKIRKDGKTSKGEQRYVLTYAGKKIYGSIDKVYLQKLIDTKEYLRIYDEKF